MVNNEGEDRVEEESEIIGDYRKGSKRVDKESNGQGEMGYYS